MAAEEKEDRLSSLPDCLLLEIISRIKIIKKYKIEIIKKYKLCKKYKEKERIMTTKEVIRTTSTLSKRWQHLWTKLPNLIFIDKDDVTRLHCNMSLTDYFLLIGQTLLQYSTDVKLNKLTLHIDYNYSNYYYNNVQFISKANSWIHYAIDHKVQHVDFRLWEKRLRRKFSYDDDLFFKNSCFMSMKLSKCLLNPVGVISWENLKSLCISEGELDEDMIEKILSGSPRLETLELNRCNGFRRIVVTSKSVKNLVFSGYGNRMDYVNTFEINAPYALSLTINGNLHMENLLLLNVSSLVKADLNYTSYTRRAEDIFMLRELLQSLGHVNEITIGNRCLKAISRWENYESVFGSLFD